MGKNSIIGGDYVFATFSREHYFTLVINKSIDISNLSYTWIWPQFTHCAVVFAQGKANFRVDKERFFLLKVFFSSLKQVIWLKTFFAAEDKTISLICFSSSKWLGERERRRKMMSSLISLPCTVFDFFDIKISFYQHKFY